MDIEKTQSQITSLSELIRHRLGARGKTLSVQAAHVRRELPRSLRPDLDQFVLVDGFNGHPKLIQRADETNLAAAYERLESHLKDIDPKDRRKGWLLGVLGSMVFNVLLVSIFLGLFLHWKGFF